MVRSSVIKVVARQTLAVSPSNIVTSGYLMNDSTELDFDWSLRPITIWLKMFGIQPPLISSVNRNSCCNRFVVIIPIALVFYLLNVGCNAFALGQMKWNATKKNYSSSTRNWNSIINEMNFSFLTLATHSVLLFVSYFMAWKGLTEVLRRLEQCHQFDSSHYKKFRSICTVGSCFMLIEIAIEFSETLYGHLLFEARTLPTLRVILSGLRMVSLVFPYLGAILFCCLGWMASIMLRIMAEEIESSIIHRPDNNSRLNNWVLMSFDGWRRRYFLIVEFVQQINWHFGFILLVITAAEFVRITNTSFQLLIEFLNPSWTLSSMSTILIAFDFIKETACFCILLYVPTRIHREASDLVKQLRRIDFDDYGPRNQLKFLVEEMTNSLPSIAPMGLVEINVQLIPTLIGTTLTYLIILCQFHSSETVK